MNPIEVIAVCMGLSVSGCATADRARAPNQPKSHTNLYVPNSTPQGEQAELSQWIDDTYAVTSSDLFRANLNALSKDYPHVWLSSGLPELDMQQLAAALAANAPYRYEDSPVYLTGNEKHDEAHAGQAENGTASMTLGRLHLKQYRSQDLVERSCAINSMAHETTHTLTNSPQFTVVVLDTGGAAHRSDSSVPLTSYLVGTVAQCTYLQQKGRVHADGLMDCVKVFGVYNYNSNRCSQFMHNEPVKEREGLADPATHL